jgi:protoporphyrinogen oxidase
MNIAIIGGGMMGLTLAYRLSQQGHQVSVFESNPQLGGLTTHHDYGAFIWDRFYHVILPSDTHLINLLKEIGLEDQLQWRKTLTGFYVNQQLYSISNTLEFLKFPPLSLIGKIRLAFTLLYGSRIKNWQKLEQITVEDWLLQISGKETYEKLWKPLLLAKLGESYKRVSAVFIWSYIKRLFSARDSSLKKEQLGHVKGGYKTVFDRLSELIKSSGGKVSIGTTVKHITSHHKDGISIKYNSQEEHFDKVFFTGPVNILQQVASKDLISIESGQDLVEYLGVICMVLVTRKPLIPYYVVNIADQRVPFTGLIGMSNLVSLNETAGFHLTYLPKYVTSEDPLLQKSDEEIKKLFLAGLRSMFPDVEDSEIFTLYINRATKVQPLQVLNYSHLISKTTTKNSNFFVLNSSQFIDNTLNNNTVVKYVSNFMEHKFSLNTRS